MVVIITGTPGTGKTTLASRLAHEEGRAVLSISDVLEQEGLDSEWDAGNQCFLVDVVALSSVLERHAREDPELIIDGHLSYEIDPSLVSRCIVCKCELSELKRRLEERGYGEGKVRENLDCEIFDVCFVDALERGHAPEVFWSSEGSSEFLDE
ncbi:MAG: AAA family ATPase [Candidatus Woesearchaeota archaeon]